MMNEHHHFCSIVLFFTHGVSLRSWDDTGLFDREVALYRRLQLRGVKVTFVTYGDKNDVVYQDRIPGIRICCNRWNLPNRWYIKLIPWLHRKALKAADLFKTNQSCGADIALASALYLHKPLLARCGYMWSEFAILEQDADSLRTSQCLAIEDKVFHAANGIVVTTSEMRENIRSRFVDLDKKVSIIPNYVDTDVFTPSTTLNTDGRKKICFVGRLVPQKNIQALIEAVKVLDVYLDIIGEGPLHDHLKSIAASNPRISFLGTFPHNMLPDLLRSCSAFVLPSLYEGHPKALLEAMACGAVVIGTDVTGINEVVNHGQNGWLCKPDADSIREAIREVLADSALQKKLRNNACRYVDENYALKHIVEMELDIYRQILGKGQN